MAESLSLRRPTEHPTARFLRDTLRLAFTRALLACAVAASVGCITPRSPGYSYSPERLRAEAVRRVPSMQPSELILLTTLSPESAAEALRIVAGRRSRVARAVALIDAISDPDGFAVRYHPFRNGSAQETLAAREGNCLSIAALYIALARSVGLDAHFVDASQPVSNIREERSLIVSVGHIAARVTTEEGFIFIDVAGQLRRYGVLRPIDDLQALGHYYNNRGFELIERAEESGEPVPWEEARRQFELAAGVTQGSAFAYNSLGIASARLGLYDAAFEAYSQAIRADPDLSASHVNVGALQLRMGHPAEARVSFARAAELEPDKAHIYLEWARAALLDHDPEVAGKLLHRALDVEPDLEAARSLLRSIEDEDVATAH